MLWLTATSPARSTFNQDFARPNLSGELQSLDHYRGRIIVLNFWATWCVPCVHEMPMLAKLQQEHSDRLVVIGVSIDAAEDKQKVHDFATRRRIGFPIWLNGTVDDLERFGLGEAVPATAFFDERGNLAGRVLGQLNKKRLQKRVRWMLGERKGAAPPELENNL